MRKFLVFILSLVLFSSSVSSFGVVSDYNLNRPLEISPGETKQVGFRIQNLRGGEDLMIRAGIREGYDFARIDEEFYPVKLGTIEEIFVDIEAPEDIEEGETLIVTAAFDTVIDKEEGGIALQTGQDYSIGVRVVAPPPPILSASWVTFIFTILTVLVVILVVLIILVIGERRTLKKMKGNQFYGS